MKGTTPLVLGLFAALTLSWLGLVQGTFAQLGGLHPRYDELTSGPLPGRAAGTVNQGLAVYRDLGCAECHTQQVRRPSLGSDKARGWGDRQSVARDYIYQASPQLGALRLGPDLTNLAARKPEAPTARSLYALLYRGSQGMPPYAFLFAVRPVSGEVTADALTADEGAHPAPGTQVVPTSRARALVGYLLTLSTAYDLPEAAPLAAAAQESSP